MNCLFIVEYSFYRDTHVLKTFMCIRLNCGRLLLLTTRKYIKPSSCIPYQTCWNHLFFYYLIVISPSSLVHGSFPSNLWFNVTNIIFVLYFRIKPLPSPVVTLWWVLHLWPIFSLILIFCVVTVLPTIVIVVVFFLQNQNIFGIINTSSCKPNNVWVEEVVTRYI